jgi:hypothetical protein
MRVHDMLIIKDYPEATIKARTDKAICISFEGKGSKWNLWMPKKIMKVTEVCDAIKAYRQIGVFFVDLPEWFKEENKIG